MTSNMCHGLYKLNYHKFCVVYFIRVGQKHDLHRNCSYERNSQVTRTHINVNGRQRNTWKLVFLGTRIRVLGLTSM